MSRFDDAFDAALDAYQEREYEMALQREERGDEEARRPNAVRMEVTFGELRVGDFMTNEDGPDARWVEIVAWELRDDLQVDMTFKTPQPIGVGMHERWCIERPASGRVVIDESARVSR